MDPWETQHRTILLRRTGGACAFCGGGISSRFGSGWSVARWIHTPDPLRARGSSADVPGNLWPVCAQCADEKGDMDGHEYIAVRLERGSPVHPRWRAYARIAANVVGGDDVSVAERESGRHAV
ncbi:MAG: hypothetical protein JW940_05965 [Polyangiaceae bacterium]|nr:hypothetical protein [Polyangiaceae bacterium]